MPDQDSPSKHRRRGLWWPYIAVALAFAAWSLFWFVMRGQIEDNLDRTRADLRAQGYDISWSARTIGGYPFRFEVEATDLKAVEPSGWGVTAPRLKAVAAAYKIDHWVFVASDGLTLWRPGSQAVDIQAPILRASIADANAAPRFSFEGHKLTFRPRSPDDSFPFTAANLTEIHLRPKDPDSNELLWRLEGAQTRRAGVFAQIAPLAPLSLRLSADLNKRSQFAGDDWAGSVRHWSGAGGSVTVNQLEASVGDLSVIASGGPLTVGDDGRLRGDLGLTVRQGGGALPALGAAQGGQLPLSFEPGGSRIGPIRIGPSPKIY